MEQEDFELEQREMEAIENQEIEGMLDSIDNVSNFIFNLEN